MLMSHTKKMKIGIVLAFAVYACANASERTDYVESYEKIESVFEKVMIAASNAENNDVDMFFSMIVNSLIHLGKDYYASPKEYNAVYLPISVSAMNAVRENTTGYINEMKSKYGSIQTKYISMIHELIETICTPEDMEDCDEQIHNRISKLTAKKDDYQTAAKVLFHVSDFAKDLVENANSVMVLAHQKYPLVRFLSNPQTSLPDVELLSKIYAIAHGPIRRKAVQRSSLRASRLTAETE